MEEKVREAIEGIMEQMYCAKNFECVESELKSLCKGEDIGLEGHLKCLEAASHRCNFALSFGTGRFCTCPLRLYLSKNLKK